MAAYSLLFKYKWNSWGKKWISDGKENGNTLVEFMRERQISNIWSGVGHCEIGKYIK